MAQREISRGLVSQEQSGAMEHGVTERGVAERGIIVSQHPRKRMRTQFFDCSRYQAGEGPNEFFAHSGRISAEGSQLSIEPEHVSVMRARQSPQKFRCSRVGRDFLSLGLMVHSLGNASF